MIIYFELSVVFDYLIYRPSKQKVIYNIQAIQMIKIKKETKNYEEVRNRSQSEEIFTTPGFQMEMKCFEILDEVNRFTNYEEQDQQNDELCSCTCTKCLNLVNNPQTKEVDADEKKKQKRRQYKKRQKMKIQQKKEQALKDLTSIIVDIYQLKTDSEKQTKRIEESLKTIERNENRFYQFINAVIRQQVEAIKKQIRVCLSQLASEAPNFSKVPRLYEQFMKIKDASPQVQFIINYFIKIISERNNEPPRYHRDLDKKTFKFLLISDASNRNNFLKLIRLLEQDNIKNERQKELLRIMVEMIKQKNISSDCSSSEDDSQGDYSGNQQDDEQEYTNNVTQNTTKSSQREDEQNYFSEQEQKNDSNKKTIKRKRRIKNLKLYQPSFQKTYETLLVLQKTLSNRIQERVQCNVQEDWMNQFRKKYLYNNIETKKFRMKDKE